LIGLYILFIKNDRYKTQQKLMLQSASHEILPSHILLKNSYASLHLYKRLRPVVMMSVRNVRLFT